MTSSSSKTIAIFDFDGTITWGDTLGLFLLYTVPVKKLILKSPVFIAILINYYILRRETNSTAKEKIFRLYFGGMEEKTYLKKSKNFAWLLPKFVKNKALKRIQWHKKRKHALYILSSSLIDYIEPWAKKQGFKKVISTAIKRKNGKIEGSYVTYNCWGPRKVIMFEKAVGPIKKYTTYVYGNSRGDKEILQKATYPFYKRFE